MNSNAEDEVHPQNLWRMQGHAMIKATDIYTVYIYIYIFIYIYV